MVVMLSSRPDTIISALPSEIAKYAGQAVRAIPIRLKISKGKRDRKAYNSYCCVDDVHVRKNHKNARDSKAQLDHEGNAVDDWFVILCLSHVLLYEHEKDIGSEQMAELAGDAGKMRLSLFCIGGPYGLGKELRERADVSIKLSSMVLNHQIALVLLVEQLYRSWTTLKGQKYHR
ncbi:unnamed protein product [Malus baccata var. baccata]